MMKRSNWRYFCLLGAAVFAVLLGAPLARAQNSSADSDLGEAAEAVKSLRAVSPKTVIFVFDVSGSMRGENLRRAREATITLLREAVQPGDRVALLTFGAGYHTVFDTVVKTNVEASQLIEQVPSQTAEGAGTNIRRPHHEALKILEKELPQPGAVVLLTDSFNDQPKETDPAWSDYLRYYTPGGRLTTYPDTPENRDYERLLNKLSRSRTVQMYGIGVQIDESGRPVERLPQAAPEPTDDAQSAPAASTQPVAAGGARAQGISPMLWLEAGIVIALIVLAFALQPLFRPTPLRVGGGPAGAKDFSLRKGQAIKIGGDGAQFAHDAYPLPRTNAVAATVRGAGGGRFEITLPATQTPGAEPPKVFHNGLPLENSAALTYGDEVRVSVPDPSGVAQDVRLKFTDPRESL